MVAMEQVSIMLSQAASCCSSSLMAVFSLSPAMARLQIQLSVAQIKVGSTHEKAWPHESPELAEAEARVHLVLGNGDLAVQVGGGGLL